MPIFKCPKDDCTYQTEDINAGVAVAMLTIHNNVHLASNPTDDNNQRDPKIERPKIFAGSDEETWNTFLTRWTMFKRNRKVKGTACVEQLFYCCEEDLGDSILRGHPNAVTGTEANLMKLIKKMAVIPVAISVRRAELLAVNQVHGESARSFYAKGGGRHQLAPTPSSALTLIAHK